MKAREEHRKARLQEYQEVFDSADLNKDGLLNRDELKSFSILIHQKRADRGLPSQDPTDLSDEQWDRYYNMVNERNPWDKGINFFELLQTSKNVIIYIQATQVFSEWQDKEISELKFYDCESKIGRFLFEAKLWRKDENDPKYLELIAIIEQMKYVVHLAGIIADSRMKQKHLDLLYEISDGTL